MSEKILITGANGHIGKAVIDTLLKKIPANNISALVRDSNKAQVFNTKDINVHIGNYEDINSLKNAMQDVKKVLLVSGGESINGLEQHKNVIDCAKNSGVELIAYTSRSLKNRETLSNQLMKRHFETEEYIIQSGMNYIIFRNALYMDTIPLFVGEEKVFSEGIKLSADNGKVAFALRSEMGEAIANALLMESNSDKKIYNLTGDSSYSFNDIANALTELSNKNVEYKNLSDIEYEQLLIKKGLPENVVKKTIGFITDIKNGQESQISNDMEKLLGRNPTDLKNGLKLLFNL